MPPPNSWSTTRGADQDVAETAVESAQSGRDSAAADVVTAQGALVAAIAAKAEQDTLLAAAQAGVATARDNRQAAEAIAAATEIAKDTAAADLALAQAAEQAALLAYQANRSPENLQAWETQLRLRGSSPPPRSCRWSTTRTLMTPCSWHGIPTPTPLTSCRPRCCSRFR